MKRLTETEFAQEIITKTIKSALENGSKLIENDIDFQWILCEKSDAELEEIIFN